MRMLLIASFGIAVVFWMLEVVTDGTIPGGERPFDIAMHASALAIVVLAVSARRRISMRVLGLVIFLALWTIKLFTTELAFRSSEGGMTGVIWRGAPALHNRVVVYVDENSEGPGPEPRYRFIFMPDCVNGYGLESYYRWLTTYGYAWSTALAVMLVSLWVRERRLPVQAAGNPRAPQTVYRD